MLLIALAVGTAAAQTAYSQAKLERFADAVVAVQTIAQKWLPRIGAAESDAAAKQLNDQAAAEITAAVEALPGITVAEYLEINDRSASDVILAKRINDILRRKIGN
ncbi:MAG: DUF4168 domain-containing protein [Pseudomonadota bacterium]